MFKFCFGILAAFFWVIGYQADFTIRSIPSTLEIKTEIIIEDKNQVYVLKHIFQKVERERIKQANCLYMTIWGEIRSGSHEDMERVATVILNRVESKRYPNTICEVVKQSKQFSCWNESDPNLPKMKKAFLQKTYDKSVLESIMIGKRVMEKPKLERIIDSTVLHYHSKYVNPFWSKTGKVVTRDRNHIFLTGVI